MQKACVQNSYPLVFECVEERIEFISYDFESKIVSTFFPEFDAKDIGNIISSLTNVNSAKNLESFRRI